MNNVTEVIKLPNGTEIKLLPMKLDFEDKEDHVTVKVSQEIVTKNRPEQPFHR